MKASPPGSGLRIRTATPADAPALARLRYDFRCELGDPAEGPGTFIERCASWMAPRLAAGSLWRCWVAEEDGRILGHAWAQLIEKIPNPVVEPELHAYVTNCYVVPHARGRGLGSSLLEEALAWCRARGVDAVLLWPSERSRTLYLRHGFAVREDVLELRLAPAS